jgi:hypothetical protein
MNNMSVRACLRVADSLRDRTWFWQLKGGTNKTVGLKKTSKGCGVYTKVRAWEHDQQDPGGQIQSISY